jgi:hypothetical protein
MKRFQSNFGFAFLFLPLSLGAIINFSVVFLGLAFILRGLDFYTYGLESLAMLGLAAFGAFIVLGLLMMSHVLFREGIFSIPENKASWIIGSVLRLIWICCFVMDFYAVYVSVLKFILSTPNTFQLESDYQLRPLPLTTFLGRVDLWDMPKEQLLTLAVIGLVIVMSPILLSFVRDFENGD